MNRLTTKIQVLVFLFLTFISNTTIAAQPTPPPTTFHLTGQVAYSAIEGGFYGILGDDGVKYQPTNLPRKFKKENISLKFDAKIKDSMVSAFQWGTIVELSNVSECKTTLAIDERRAIYVLLKRMDAFNNKNLLQLQQVDIPSRQLSKEQFNSWVNNYDHYTLRYVDIFSATSSSITGACYYTRKLTNGMTMHGDIDLAAMTFALTNTTNGWKLTESATLIEPPRNDQSDVLADLKKKAVLKYKTDNLATLYNN